MPMPQEIKKVSHTDIQAYRQLGYSLDEAVVFSIEDAYPDFKGGDVIIKDVTTDSLFFTIRNSNYF